MAPVIRRGVRRLFRLAIHRRDIVRDDMDAELHFHLEARTAQLVAQGWPADAARAEATRRLGDSYTATQDRLRRSAQQKDDTMALRERIDDVIQDVRYALRGLRQRPGFTAVAILTLAIGIGANTAIFSAVDAILLRALPFPHPEQLMDVAHYSSVQGPTQWSWAKFGVFRNAAHSYSSLALHAQAPATFTGPDPERAKVEWVSGEYLKVLGIAPALGGDFPANQDAGGGMPRRTIISDDTWQHRFNAAPDVVGKFLDVDGEAYQVIGVLPPTFRGLSGKAQALLDITSRPAEELGPHEAWSLEFDGIGRLKPGVSAEQAAAEARLIGPQVFTAYPLTEGMLTTATNERWGASARPLDAIRVDPVVRRALQILFASVLLVLLIACVNLANLLLGRAAARRQEMAVRLAIGAGRGRLIRMLLTESMMLALCGGLASMMVAWGGTHALAHINADDALQAEGFSNTIGTNGFESIHLDGRALLFALAATIAVGVLFGLVPAWQATHPELTGDLKQGSAGSGRSARTSVTRRLLVVAEVALSLVLLAGAGLMLRSLSRLVSVNPGFDGAGVLTMRLSVPPGNTAPDSMPGFYDLVRTSLAAIPGVQDAALADCPPLNGGCNGTIMTFPDRPQTATGNALVGVHWVSADWFHAMRIPLLRGRGFDSRDGPGSPRVVLINQAAARKYFAGHDPIGQRVKVWQGGFDAGATVIGIVGDVRFNTIDSAAAPDTYISFRQSHVSRMMIFLRTTGNPERLAPAARRVLHEIAPLDPVYDIRSMADRIGSASAEARSMAILLALFAAIALALAVIGIYGVMSFGVAQRTREIGIRLALGATRNRVLGMIVREGAALAAIGCMLGLVGAFIVTRVMRTLLFEVAPSDPMTYVAIVTIVAAATLAASWVPARRAAALRPTEALGERR